MLSPLHPFQTYDTDLCFSVAGTHFDEYDMSQINTQTGQFYVATSYHYDKGTWTNQATKPPPIYEIGLARKAARMNETDLKLLNASM